MLADPVTVSLAIRYVPCVCSANFFFFFTLLFFLQTLYPLFKTTIFACRAILPHNRIIIYKLQSKLLERAEKELTKIIVYIIGASIVNCNCGKGR